MQKRIYYVLFFLIIVFEGLSQNLVDISGDVLNRPFDHVRIYVNDDEFSGLKIEKADFFTDENGHFAGKLDVEQTKTATIKLGLAEHEFYLKPGSVFYFKIYPDTIDLKPFFEISNLNVEMKARDEGLNDSITSFNVMYNYFMSENVVKLFRGGNKQLLYDFEEKVNERFKGFDNEYFKVYVKYTLAALELSLRTKSLTTFFNEYFSGKTIYYNNIQYAEFFKQFFKEYINRNIYNKYFNELRRFVYESDVDSIDNILKSNKILASDTRLRELVLINTIERFYFDKNFSRSGVLKMLEYISNNSQYKIHKKIAANYLIKITKLSPGTAAPDFTLPMLNGKQVSLSSLKGHFIILNFVKGNCIECIKQIDFLKDIQEKFGANLKIVFVIYGQDNDRFVKALKDKYLDGIVLYLGKRTDILDDYEVKVFPTYIIITPDGKIGKVPASMADEKLEEELKMLIYRNRIKNGK